MLGNTRLAKVVDHLLAGVWVALLFGMLGIAFCGCTEPNPEFDPVTGPIRQPGDPGTVPGAPDGGAQPDSGTAPDVTAPRPDAGGGGTDAAGDAGGNGCPVIVASCTGQKRGVLCGRPACTGGTETSAGTCDGADNCDPGAQTAGCPTVCTSNAGCAAGFVCTANLCRPCGAS